MLLFGRIRTLLQTFHTIALTSLLCQTVVALPETEIALDDAVRFSLANQTELELRQEDLARIQGQLMEASGAFDPEVFGSLRHGFRRIPLTPAEREALQMQGLPDTESFKTNETEYTLGVGTLFRTGISSDLGVTFTREEDHLTGQPPVNRSRVVLGLNIPLARGLGNPSVAARERAAGLGVHAARFEVVHSASTVVRDTAVAYWNTLAAREAVELRQDSRRRALDLLSSIERLVEADELPRSTIDQARANLSEREVELMLAENDYFLALQSFGLTLGLESDRLIRTPRPAGEFPAPEDIRDELNHLPDWIRRGLVRRADLKGSKILEESSRQLRTGARNDTRPRVDLRLEADYNQSSDGTDRRSLATPFRSRQAGPGAFVVLDMDWPFPNREARGRLRQRQAEHRMSLLNTQTLTRQIGSEIAGTFNSLVSNTREIERNRATVELYRNALEDEERKFQMGMATIIDVVQTQERLTQALLNELDSHRRYSTNLARLRFALGDLLQEFEDDLELDLDKLVHPPRTDPQAEDERNHEPPANE